jgi:hypothetical protein
VEDGDLKMGDEPINFSFVEHVPVPLPKPEATTDDCGGGQEQQGQQPLHNSKPDITAAEVPYHSIVPSAMVLCVKLNRRGKANACSTCAVMKAQPENLYVY